MVLPLFILLLATSVQKSRSVKVLRNTLSVSDPSHTGGIANLTNGANDVAVEDITICIRFNLERLATLSSHSAPIMYMGDSHDSKLTSLAARHPHTFITFGDNSREGARNSYLLKNPKTGR